MIRYVKAHELHAFPLLASSMFRDRTAQFRDRLRWDVSVDARGHERDQYDDLDPLYVIWERPDGTHGGSMRFLPTTGRCMVNEHFLHLTEGKRIESPLIWECTRFCLAPGAGPEVSAALMLAGGDILRNLGLRHFVGVFDGLMVRVYSRIGALPVVLGSAGKGRDRISIGLWEYSEAARDRLIANCGISGEQSARWFDQAALVNRVPLALSA